MKEIHAPDWSTLGDERIPRWPSQIGEKRGLRVQIDTWKGVSVGARHWYVKVHEQDNQWWCESENAWVDVYCDSGKGGYDLRADVFTKEEAVKLALVFVELVAGKRRKHHEVHWDGPKS